MSTNKQMFTFAHIAHNNHVSNRRDSDVRFGFITTGLS